MAPRKLSGGPVKRAPLGQPAIDCRPGGSEARRKRATRGHTLELPIPPSVNSLAHTRTGRPLGNKSASVVHWRQLADGDLWQQKPLPKIEGPYHIRITWPLPEFGKYDCDNRIKILSDFLEARGIIRNDRDCMLVMAYFGPDVERDRCRVELWEAKEDEDQTAMRALRTTTPTSGIT